MDKWFHYSIEGIRFHLVMLVYNFVAIFGGMLIYFLISYLTNTPQQYTMGIGVLYFLATIPFSGWLYYKIPSRQFKQRNVKLMDMSGKE